MCFQSTASKERKTNVRVLANSLINSSSTRTFDHSSHDSVLLHSIIIHLAQMIWAHKVHRVFRQQRIRVQAAFARA